MERSDHTETRKDDDKGDQDGSRGGGLRHGGSGFGLDDCVHGALLRNIFARKRKARPARQRVMWAGRPASPGWASAPKNGADMWSPPLVHH